MPQTTGVTLRLYGDTKSEHQKALGHILIAMRKKNGLSAKQISDLVGRSVSYITMVERGERHVDADYLTDLAKHYGFSKASRSKDKTSVTLSYNNRGKHTVVVECVPSIADAMVGVSDDNQMTPQQVQRLQQLLTAFVEKPWLIDAAFDSLNA